MMLWEGDVETIGLLVEFVVFVIMIGGGVGEEFGSGSCRGGDGDEHHECGVGECHGFGAACLSYVLPMIIHYLFTTLENGNGSISN